MTCELTHRVCPYTTWERPDFDPLLDRAYDGINVLLNVGVRHDIDAIPRLVFKELLVEEKRRLPIRGAKLQPIEAAVRKVSHGRRKR